MRGFTMPDSDRPKAGPADPATQRKALADYEASARRENADRAKAAGSKNSSQKPRGSSSKGSLLHDLRDAINDLVGPHESAHQGKSVTDIVDEAVNGAKGANPDY